MKIFFKEKLITSLINFGVFYGKLIDYKIFSDHIFIFSSYNLGGSERVHSNITYTVKGFKPTIIFYFPPIDGKLKYAFEGYGSILDIGKRNKFFFYISFGKIIAALNKKEKGIVFGNNNTMYFMLLNYITNNNLTLIDITHTFQDFAIDPTRFLDTYKKLNKRVVIDNETLNMITSLYKSNNMESFLCNVKLINNGVKIPTKLVQRNFNQPVKICYVGRNDPVKRLNLWNKIVSKVNATDKDIQFYMIGDCEKAIHRENKKIINNLGVVIEKKQLEKIYMEMTLMLLTSKSEGFPMCLMESMAFGVIPITTPVGGIPYHIHDKQNGFIIDGISEEEIVTNASQIIYYLSFNREMLAQISINAHEYAKTNFSIEKFTLEYQNLFSING